MVRTMRVSCAGMPFRQKTVILQHEITTHFIAPIDAMVLQDFISH